MTFQYVVAAAAATAAEVAAEAEAEAERNGIAETAESLLLPEQRRVKRRLKLPGAAKRLQGCLEMPIPITIILATAVVALE